MTVINKLVFLNSCSLLSISTYYPFIFSCSAIIFSMSRNQVALLHFLMKPGEFNCFIFSSDQPIAVLIYAWWRVMERIVACIPPTLEGWVYIIPIHGPLDGSLYTWAQYTPTILMAPDILFLFCCIQEEILSWNASVLKFLGYSQWSLQVCNSELYSFTNY